MELTDRGKIALDFYQEFDSLFSQSTNSFTHFHTQGKNRTSVLRELEVRLNQDTTYKSGKILGAMTTEPHEFAKYVYYKYIDRNLGDRGLNPATAEIEQEVIRMLGELLGDGQVHGNFTSGGTEANIMAIFLAKKHAEHKATQNGYTIKHPNIVIPASAHYSFDKAAALMNFEIRKARLDKSMKLDVHHYKSLVNEDTFALVGITGTSSLGLVDPIQEIAMIARKNNIYLHVDAAFGGLALPFLDGLGFNFQPYDFRVPEVCSMTVDPHKMGTGVNPSGCLLVRDSNLLNFGFQIPYLAGGAFTTYNLLGTRPGAPAIAFWALIHHYGKEGFKDLVDYCWKNTLYIKDRLETIPQIEIVAEPQMNVLGFRLSKFGLQESWTLDKLDQALREKGWALGKFTEWNLLRLVLMPHITRRHLDAFLVDLENLF